jgi:hypothetical protein
MNVPLARDTQDLLDALERHKEVKGTLPLFDALWSGDPAAVQAALADFLAHPLAGRVGDWLEARGAARPTKPSGAEILERRGIEDVSGWIDRHEKEVAQLRRERDVAVQQRSDALKTANALAMMLVVLAGVALIGWLAAFGVMPFTPVPIPDGRPLPHDGSKQGAQDVGTGTPP